MTDTLVLPYAERLLDCLCDALADSLGGPVCRCCLRPGAHLVPMDSCYCECGAAGSANGQASVQVTNVYPSSKFPRSGVDEWDDACNTVTWVAELTMTVYRCVHTVDEKGVPPTCDQLDSDARKIASDRFAMINYAVDKLKANLGTHVYLDGTHSSWLGANDAADRLLQAGVTRADGFFLNLLNYRSDAYLEHYGRWISQCIWFGDPSSGSWGGGHAEWCASQYYVDPIYGVVNPNDITTWGASDAWYTANVESQTWVPYPGDAGLKRFVIDTSRNGLGPWTPTAAYPDAQDWCNPPLRGVGARPTADTGNALLDARLWVKIPGESDGECTRGLGPGGTTVDPEWGIVDPTAGYWFPEMALQLAQNAVPPLSTSCH